MKAELVLKETDITGEGLIWHAQRASLFWVDIEGCRIHEFHPQSGSHLIYRLNQMGSTIVPDTMGNLIITLQDKIIRFNPNTQQIEKITDIETELPDNRCNDGKADSEGRLWIGTMSLSVKADAGSLYCLEKGKPLRKALSNLTIPNGLVWSADNKTFYYIDTTKQTIDKYKYNNITGDISYQGVAVHIPKGTGGADGMTIDREGKLWVAQWGGFGVYCYNPDTGEFLTKIEVPAPHIANCTFAGPLLDTLYITSARAGLTKALLEQYPLSGSLFAIKLNTKGYLPNCYKG
jgi:sugar lactone lactonase YvrE